MSGFDNKGLMFLLKDYARQCWQKKALPRLHGNGFIQVDINEVLRMNFWSPEFPRQTVDTGWHDHTFGFTSTCVRGKLYNFTFKAKESDKGQFNGYFPKPRDGEDTELVKLTPRFNLTIEQVTAIAEGNSYSMQPFTIHRTEVKEPTITLMLKTAIQGKGDLPSKQKKATVFCPVGLEPDNNFNRNEFDAKWLWETVHDMLTLKD